MSGRKLVNIKKAVGITEMALKKVLSSIKEGARERDIAAALKYHIKRLGGHGFSFLPIVASGRRSVLPHGRASEKKIRRGDAVVVDFGVKFNGYLSDITRTFVVGKAGRKQWRIYKILLEAQRAGIKKIGPGIPACEIDAAVRKVLGKNGLEKYFIHKTGHGIGRRIHESPGLSRKNNKLLKPGTVVTVEPGVYIKGWGGMRVEDMILVTKSGKKVLTNFPKKLVLK